MGVQSAGSIAGTAGAWRSRKSRSLPAGGVDLDPVAPGLQHRDPRVEIAMLPVGEGLTLLRVVR